MSWDKQEGDEVKEGDIIAQVETDKAVMDMETTESGFIAIRYWYQLVLEIYH